MFWHFCNTQADERAVLRHFQWPEKKADAMREAAIEYRSLKLLETEVYSYKDDTTVPCGTALKKMAGLLDKYVQFFSYSALLYRGVGSNN